MSDHHLHIILLICLGLLIYVMLRRKQTKKKGNSGSVSISNKFGYGAEIIDICRKSVFHTDPQPLFREIKQIAAEKNISDKKLRNIIIQGWSEAVEKAFEDGILTEDEEASLMALQSEFSLMDAELEVDGSLTKVRQGKILRLVLNGEIPDIELVGQPPFNLMKNEKLVWVIDGVDYLEEKTRTHYVGGSRGVSVRIAKGLYYRASGFKGERVQSSETVLQDTGILGITDKHIYFSGASKKFRIKYPKIVEFTPFEDGFGLQRDVASAKPQSFITGDGWFIYNLVTNLARL